MSNLFQSIFANGATLPALLIRPKAVCDSAEAGTNGNIESFRKLC